ncbi:MAG: enoyl-CoA hydratase [Deltaproteobacteria bacterium]|nr:enoyl-CoA hydratase [Deltaproteobacteria bacterium]
MASESLQREVRDRVLYLTLNRPEKLNALTVGLMSELLEQVAAAQADDAVGCLVVQGAGRAFCSGWDLTPSPSPSPSLSPTPTPTPTPTAGAAGEASGAARGHGARPPEEMSIREDIDALTARSGRWVTLWNSTKPVIAKVQGYCLAGGTDLALNCDMIVAGEDAEFGFPAVRSMGSPSTHMWTYLVGPQWAKRLLLSGERIDGRRAEQIGLVMQAVPQAELDETVHALASNIARVPYDLLAQNKSICNKAIELMGRTMLQELARESNAMAHKSPSAQEFSRIAQRDGLKAALAWQNR